MKMTSPFLAALMATSVAATLHSQVKESPIPTGGSFGTKRR